MLEHFRDQERREAFYGFFRELEELYEILSPDAFLRPFIADYGALAAMYQLRAGHLRAAGVLVDRSFLRKTAALVQEHTATREIQTPTKIHRLDAETLAALARPTSRTRSRSSTCSRPSEGLSDRGGGPGAIPDRIGDRAERSPGRSRTGRRRPRRRSRELRDMIREITEAREHAARRDLSARGIRGVLVVASGRASAEAEEVARAAAGVRAAPALADEQPPGAGSAKGVVQGADRRRSRGRGGPGPEDPADATEGNVMSRTVSQEWGRWKTSSPRICSRPRSRPGPPALESR